jgi:hypothetical protein
LRQGERKYVFYTTVSFEWHQLAALGISATVLGIIGPLLLGIALIGLLGIVSAAMAFGWVGMNMLQQHIVAGAEAPSSVQAALR